MPSLVAKVVQPVLDAVVELLQKGDVRATAPHVLEPLPPQCLLERLVVHDLFDLRHLNQFLGTIRGPPISERRRLRRRNVLGVGLDFGFVGAGLHRQCGEVVSPPIVEGELVFVRPFQIV